MTAFSLEELQQAYRSALYSWSSPHKNFSSGFDPRTSDNAILSLLSGGLCHAQQNNWLNAGRRLIDKTYVHIVFVTQGLSSIPFINAESTAAALDDFIRSHIAPVWPLIVDSQEPNTQEITAELINTAAGSLFGSLQSVAAASHILFFLCPTLPIIPVSRKGPYSDHIQDCLKAIKSQESYLDALKIPKAGYGHPGEIKRVTSLLIETDWWYRNVIRVAHLNRSLERPGL